eukprot:TRINITY_DN556_c0_g1_i2.p1 TRINITY_DN556_c0_g1~~TRINITY_DN556_c0_g1_i2.p1  ORF type:complete len:754 (-),score=211.46 TRINITY_DN556_c0_g1_i2:129-2390(-)
MCRVRTEEGGGDDGAEQQAAKEEFKQKYKQAKQKARDLPAEKDPIGSQCAIKDQGQCNGRCMWLDPLGCIVKDPRARAAGKKKKQLLTNDIDSICYFNTALTALFAGSNALVPKLAAPLAPGLDPAQAECYGFVKKSLTFIVKAMRNEAQLNEDKYTLPFIAGLRYHCMDTLSFESIQQIFNDGGSAAMTHILSYLLPALDVKFEEVSPLMFEGCDKSGSLMGCISQNIQNMNSGDDAGQPQPELLALVFADESPKFRAGFLDGGEAPTIMYKGKPYEMWSGSGRSSRHNVAWTYHPPARNAAPIFTYYNDLLSNGPQEYPDINAGYKEMVHGGFPIKFLLFRAQKPSGGGAGGATPSAGSPGVGGKTQSQVDKGSRQKAVEEEDAVETPRRVQKKKKNKPAAPVSKVDRSPDAPSEDTGPQQKTKKKPQLAGEENGEADDMMGGSMGGSGSSSGPLDDEDGDMSASLQERKQVKKHNVHDHKKLKPQRDEDDLKDALVQVEGEQTSSGRDHASSKAKHSQANGAKKEHPAAKEEGAKPKTPKGKDEGPPDENDDGGAQVGEDTAEKPKKHKTKEPKASGAPDTDPEEDKKKKGGKRNQEPGEDVPEQEPGEERIEDSPEAEGSEKPDPKMEDKKKKKGGKRNQEPGEDLPDAKDAGATKSMDQEREREPEEEGREKDAAGDEDGRKEDKKKGGKRSQEPGEEVPDEAGEKASEKTKKPKAKEPKSSDAPDTKAEDKAGQPGKDGPGKKKASK